MGLLSSRVNFEIGQILHLKSRNPKSQVGLLAPSALRVQFEVSDFGI